MRRAMALALAAVLLIVLAAASDTVTICHHRSPLEDPFGTNPETQTIPISALPGHLRHGDTIGPCGAQPTPRPTVRPTPVPTPRATPKATPRATPAPATPVPSAMPTTPPTDAVLLMSIAAVTLRADG